MSNLYKRPTNKDKVRRQHYKTNKKHPIEQIVSTVPQLAITLAILFCLSTYYQADLIQHGKVFSISCISFIIMSAIFLILQLSGAEYRNWEQNPKTRRYIQVASASAVISFIGFTCSYWHIYSLFSLVFVSCQFIFVTSFLTVLLSIKDLLS
ncbi:unnamed protein product [Rhizopus microsporus]|uniref:Uncharacterized protein n=1 Tax=Rhizopus microsporus TaxID=58291 RepID=A0A1X0SE98_RHIZD|nr:hypothetical protein BCV71DRAFT_288078 [Rhizopus microsporus]